MIQNILLQPYAQDINEQLEMTSIKKKPNLKVFRYSIMYREIKGRCAEQANCRDPNDNWSLECGLMKRECGLTGNRNGSFSSNQHRRIVNHFIPNKRIDRLMALDTKMFICRFNHSGSRLTTISQDAVVRIFDSSKGIYNRIKRMRLRDANWGILDIDYSPCGKEFAYSTWSNYFFVASLEGEGDDPVFVSLINNQRNGMFSVRFSPVDNGRILVGGCNNSNIYICDREHSMVRLMSSNDALPVDINAISFTSDLDGNILATGCNNGLLKLWDLRCYQSANNSNHPNSQGQVRSKPVSVFYGHLDGITYIDPRNDGRYLLSNSRDQSIKIWDLRHPSPYCDLNCFHQQRCNFLPRSHLDTDVSIMTYRGHRVSKSLLRARFSPTEQTGQRYIYTGCSTGRIIIYDVLTGHIKETIEGHRDIVRDLDWHPLRSEIVSASWDCHVNLNSYRWNGTLKRPSMETVTNPLRRSTRIAHREGYLSDMSNEDNEYNDW